MESDLNTTKPFVAKWRSPVRMVLLSLAIVAAIVGLGSVTDWLNRTANVQPGTINIAKVLLSVLLVIAGLVWLGCCSRFRKRKVWVLVGLLLFGLFFASCRLVFDGDLGFVRIESRFGAREWATVGERSRSAVDLRTTTKYDFWQFLGPHRNGTVPGVTLNKEWNQQPPVVLWRQSVGEGWSGISVVNGAAVTQEQRGSEECVTCYDLATGELLWIHQSTRRHADLVGLGKVGPRATPTIHEGRVYVQGGTGILECLDGSNGERIWSVDLAQLLDIEMITRTNVSGWEYQYEDSSLAWGRSGSPLIYHDKVIVTGGGPAAGPFHTLIAFDKQTGAERWRGGDQMIAYGSPSLARLLGRDQITLVAESAAMGFDPDTGTVLWTTQRPGSSNADANCSQVVPVAEDLVLLAKAYQLGGELVRLVESHRRIEPQSVWKNSRVLKTKMMTPVIRDGYAYLLSDGFLECSAIADPEDQGNRVWRQRSRFGNGQLLLVDDVLLVHTEYGVLKLIEATPERYIEWGELRTIQGVCWNTICLYKNYLLVRSELEMACIQLPWKVADE